MVGELGVVGLDGEYDTDLEKVCNGGLALWSTQLRSQQNPVENFLKEFDVWFFCWLKLESIL